MNTTTNPLAKYQIRVMTEDSHIDYKTDDTDSAIQIVREAYDNSQPIEVLTDDGYTLATSYDHAIRLLDIQLPPSKFSLVRITRNTADKAKQLRKHKRVYSEAVFTEAIDLLYDKTFGKQV